MIESYREMAARHYRSLPVIDDHGILVGMLALQDLLHLLIPSTEHGDHPRQVTASIEKISQILEAEVVTTVESAGFEQQFLTQRADEARPVADTLDRAWATLALLPDHELNHLPVDLLRQVRDRLRVLPGAGPPGAAA